MEAKCGYCLGDVTSSGVCVKNCQEQLRMNIGSHGWLNPKFITAIDEHSGESRKNRRRRVFEQYVFALIKHDDDGNLREWNWYCVNNNVEILLKKSDEFANKAQGEK
tara:strand:+ start:205 stop:525 length:321 start_codon:yes stop_codon:yes gene_type:complete